MKTINLTNIATYIMAGIAILGFVWALINVVIGNYHHTTNI